MGNCSYHIIEENPETLEVVPPVLINGDSKSGYQYHDLPRTPQRCTRRRNFWKRFLLSFISTTLLLGLFLHLFTPGCVHKAIGRYGNGWPNNKGNAELNTTGIKIFWLTSKINLGNYLPNKHHGDHHGHHGHHGKHPSTSYVNPPTQGSPSAPGNPLPILPPADNKDGSILNSIFEFGKMTVFNMQSFMKTTDKCEANIPVHGLDTYKYDPKDINKVHVAIEGSIFANIHIVGTDNDEGKFGAEVLVSDDSLVSHIEVYKIQIDKNKNRFVLKGPKFLARDKCVSANVYLSIPTSLSEFGDLSISFGNGKLEVDKQLTKDVSFNSFHVGSIKGNFKLNKISANSVTVDNALGKIKGDFVVKNSVVLRTIKGDINTKIQLTEGNHEQITLESVVGNIKSEISQNFNGRFSVASGIGKVEITDEGNGTHIHFDKDYKHYKTGSHFTGDKLEGESRLTIANVKGDSIISFV